jgi:hypothetical protein
VTEHVYFIGLRFQIRPFQKGPALLGHVACKQLSGGDASLYTSEYINIRAVLNRLLLQDHVCGVLASMGKTDVYTEGANVTCAYHRCTWRLKKPANGPANR